MVNDSKNELIRLKNINLKTKEERWLKPLNRTFFIYNDKMYYVIQNGIYTCDLGGEGKQCVMKEREISEDSYDGSKDEDGFDLLEGSMEKTKRSILE